MTAPAQTPAAAPAKPAPAKAPAAKATAPRASPPLLDRELFFGNPEIAGAQLSPTGSGPPSSSPGSITGTSG